MNIREILSGIHHTGMLIALTHEKENQYGCKKYRWDNTGTEHP